jgi:hypothetical protein
MMENSALASDDGGVYANPLSAYYQNKVWMELFQMAETTAD